MKSILLPSASRLVVLAPIQKAGVKGGIFRSFASLWQPLEKDRLAGGKTVTK